MKGKNEEYRVLLVVQSTSLFCTNVTVLLHASFLLNPVTALSISSSLLSQVGWILMLSWLFYSSDQKQTKLVFFI